MTDARRGSSPTRAASRVSPARGALVRQFGFKSLEWFADLERVGVPRRRPNARGRPSARGLVHLDEVRSHDMFADPTRAGQRTIEPRSGPLADARSTEASGQLICLHRCPRGAVAVANLRLVDSQWETCVGDDAATFHAGVEET